VIDASTAVYLVLDNPLSEKVDALWQVWVREGVGVCVPGLWLNEVTSALHKVTMQKAISEERALDALEAILSLGVEAYDQDADLCRTAFALASELGQLAAYDGFYLALAQGLETEFWTADKRLATRAHQIGLSWVRWVGE